jgi:hypothetical protein
MVRGKVAEVGVAASTMSRCNKNMIVLGDAMPKILIKGVSLTGAQLGGGSGVEEGSGRDPGLTSRVVDGRQCELCMYYEIYLHMSTIMA